MKRVSSAFKVSVDFSFIEALYISIKSFFQSKDLNIKVLRIRSKYIY